MKKKEGVILLILLLLLATPYGFNYWVYHQIQDRLGIEIQGDFRPDIFVPKFEVRDATFDWEDRVMYEKGDIRVSFDWLHLFFKEGIRIRIESQNSQIKLLGEWAKLQGVSEASIDSLIADLVVTSSGLSDIYEVEARSKDFQFSIHKGTSR